MRHTNPILRPAVGISAVVVPQNIHRGARAMVKKATLTVGPDTKVVVKYCAGTCEPKLCVEETFAASRPKRRRTSAPRPSRTKPPLAASARKRRKAPAPRRSRLDPQGSLHQSAVASKHQGPPSLGGSAMVPAASSPMRPFSLELSNLFC